MPKAFRLNWSMSCTRCKLSVVLAFLTIFVLCIYTYLLSATPVYSENLFSRDLNRLSVPERPIYGVKIVTRNLAEEPIQYDAFNVDFTLETLKLKQNQKIDRFESFSSAWNRKDGERVNKFLAPWDQSEYRESVLSRSVKSNSISSIGPHRDWLLDSTLVIWNETCDVTVKTIQAQLRIRNFATLDQDLRNKIAKLYEAAAKYEIAVQNFYVRAANEIKLHGCGPETEQIGRKWMIDLIEFRIATRDGMALGVFFKR